jgi:phosphatidylethanolamine-binding protein (PEBP) family uncharacterized protein
MKLIILSGFTLSLLVASIAACGGSDSGATSSTAATSTSTASVNSSGAFALTSSVAVEGGALPADYTCDGRSASPPLAWANVPAGTREFALLMTTIPVTGTVKYNWVLSGIPASTSGLTRNTSGVGASGVGSDGPAAGYQSPCSQGPGLKTYTFTMYALSASPALSVAANAVTGATLSTAIPSITLGSSTLNHLRQHLCLRGLQRLGHPPHDERHHRN